MREVMKLFAVLLCAVSLAACSSTQKKSEKEQDSGKSIKADVIGADGVLGEVTFKEVDDGVSISLMVRNLPKGKTLASHIHEKGKCAPPDFKSAGGHFNPKNKKHGAPGSKEHHVGDLGNFEVDKNGVLKVEKTFSFLSLEEGAKNYIGGRTLVIHAEKDKFTQPVGGAGARLACAELQ